MTFPGQHRTKLHGTSPLERINKEVKRRADVVGIFPNEAAIVRLIGAVLLEQNDECRFLPEIVWREMDSNHRYPVKETPLCGLPPFHTRNSPSATKTDFFATATDGSN